MYVFCVKSRKLYVTLTNDALCSVHNKGNKYMNKYILSPIITSQIMTRLLNLRIVANILSRWIYRSSTPSYSFAHFILLRIKCHFGGIEIDRSRGRLSSIIYASPDNITLVRNVQLFSVHMCLCAYWFVQMNRTLETCKKYVGRR